jgi:hypothetical protein
VIGLGLRLTLAGGKEAAVRLAVTVAAVGLGVGLLLISLSGMNAINAQNARTAWLNTGQFRGPHGSPVAAGDSGHPGSAPGSTHASASGPAPGMPGAPKPGAAGAAGGSGTSAAAALWWLYRTDHFGNQAIDRVDVAATGRGSPVPPGISHLPGPGQFYASPALSKLLRSTPAVELGDRFPGRQIGTIGSAALPAPNSLIIIVGDSAAQLSQVPGAAEVTEINTTTGHSGGANGFDSNTLEVILAVGALALLVPVLMFIGTATRLSAARREQRFAAIRLVGASPRQVSVISAVEASVAALGGVAVGFGVFFLLRPVLTNVPFTGQPFAPGDLSLNAVDILLAVLGVPIAAVAAARIAMRRVQISPLGVTRRVSPPAPHAYRLLPLAAGVAELAYFAAAGSPEGTGAQILVYFSGFLLIMAGLVSAGPWLTMLGSRLMARRTSRPAVLIAGRRLSDNPQAAFRAIAGLIIAIFVTSVSVGVITTILDDHSAASATAAQNALIDQFGNRPPPGQPVSTTPVPASLIARLRSISGVQGVAVFYGQPASGNGSATAAYRVLARCDQIARTPAIGRCPSGVKVVTITRNLDSSTVTSHSALAQSFWPRAAVTPGQLRNLPIRGIVVQTGPSSFALERARTVLEVALPGQGLPVTLSEINAASTRTIAELQQLTNAVILISLVVAGCSLAVSVTAGVTDRKRPFSLLRLTGVSLKALRRVVALEAGVPLLIVAFLAAGIGYLAAALFLQSQLGEALQPPKLAYYVLLGAGLIASLGIIASTLPVIGRITGPEVARNE